MTGIAAISFTGGTIGLPVPLGADGIPELTADPEGLLDVQEKIRVALRNVDKVSADNELAVKDTLRNFETFTASLSGHGERITSIISAAESGVGAVDDALGKTQNFLGGLASDKYGGDLLPTVIRCYSTRWLGWGRPLLSFVALTRPFSQGRKRFVSAPTIRQLTAVSPPLSPISDVMRKPVRRRRVCLRPIPRLQYRRGSPGADNQTRSC